MSKFDRVLSDEWLPLEFKSGNDVPVTSLMVNLKTLKSIVEQAEQAVLEKLAEQEPVAYLYDDEVFGAHSGAINEHIRKEGQPLYTHPMPNCQGFLNNSNHITDMRKKVPEGWQLVPVELTEEMKKSGGHVNSEWLNDFAPVGEKRYAIPMEGVYKAMLAAAPKFTGESK